MFTIAHAYNFDTNEPAQKAAYAELCEKLRAAGRKPFVTHGGGSHYLPQLDGVTVELETAFLYHNQWNTKPGAASDKGLRVFDWAEDTQSHIGAPKGVHRGHWLEQTPEMVAIRRETATCGYCGKFEPVSKGLKFCPHCLGGAYLTEKDLPLTRLRPVCDSKATRAPLSESELAERLPLFLAAQLKSTGDAAQKYAAKKRADVLATYEKTAARITDERDGYLWLLDRGYNCENVLFYSHTGRFSFGWRKPLSDAERAAVLDFISEFSFPYELKCADGRTLSGN